MASSCYLEQQQALVPGWLAFETVKFEMTGIQLVSMSLLVEKDACKMGQTGVVCVFYS